MTQRLRQRTGTRDLAVEDHEIQGLDACGMVETGYWSYSDGLETPGFSSQDHLDQEIRVRNEEGI